jgi:hypothetical protein
MPTIKLKEPKKMTVK